MNQPLVSIIVPTLNSAKTLSVCLNSIRQQTYPAIELIVVDRNSKDHTKKIARQFTKLVFNKEPERCAQRNFGAHQAGGQYLFFIDSDMILEKTVVTSAINQFGQTGAAGIIVPEESFGQGFWASCKRLERSFYIGVPWIEAARFFKRETFFKVGGYDENLVSAEDWDLSQKISALGPLARITDLIHHYEGQLSLTKTIRKKYYYAQKLVPYVKKQANSEYSALQVNPWTRYKLFFARPRKLFTDPLLGLGLLILKTSEFGAGLIGYGVSRLKSKR